ncbi:11626_t:CDS:1 [Entrophospora sp. SA101]|nr:10024_t:CDS:1 [Entrophospora sp. SA101]CAJ0762663.1 11626_t:CDS:1 [Entrophospora sp. SA101]CAJ0839786.1 9075_t:CDS:1 [Entrophospora sp. SA101]CAJ0892683.1 14511_t:CDS:1 [Entrophospora sp. SA101]CAJ0899606.1 4573_t:CDS:1 [Entrophospora sp. SA101]
MVSFKSFSIATLSLVLLFLSPGLAKLECPKPSATSKDFNKNQERFMIMLKPQENPSVASSAIDEHLKYFNECWGLKSDSALDKPGTSAFSEKSDKILHFSVGGISGYSGSFNSKFVKEHIKGLPNIAIVEKVLEAKAIGVINKRATAIERNPPVNLDRIDTRKYSLDRTYRFPSSGGKGVNVYIVDTGINIAHREFGGRAVFGGSFCAGCPRFDDQGHGTAVASVVGGRSLGVAKNVKLISVKVLNSQGSGRYDEIIVGLAFVFKDYLLRGKKRTVINMSLGGPRFEPLNLMVKFLTDKGIHVVVAAGNEARDACGVSPASSPSAITVGATELKSDSMADFSNFGQCVDMFAPGRDIKVASFRSTTGITTLSGTSFSSPEVAGAAALILSERGNISPPKLSKFMSDRNTKGVVRNLRGQTKNNFLFVL